MLTDKDTKNLKNLAGMNGKLLVCVLFFGSIYALGLGFFAMHTAYEHAAASGISFTEFLRIVYAGKRPVPAILVIYSLGFHCGSIVCGLGIITLVFWCVLRRLRRTLLHMFETLQEMSRH